jgi:hypothetical protein
MKRKMLIPIKNYLSEWDSVGFFNAELSDDDKFSGIIGRKDSDGERQILHQFPFEIDYLDYANDFVEGLYGWNFDYSELPPHLVEQIKVLDEYGLKSRLSVSIQQGEESLSYGEELSHTLEGILSLEDEAIDVWGIVDTWADQFDPEDKSTATYKSNFREYLKTKIAFFTQEVKTMVKNTDPRKINYRRKIGFSFDSPFALIDDDGEISSLFGSTDYEKINLTISLEIVANYR